MQQDQKIGLALAVLLIGFAGAFCFRHERVIEHPPLALNRGEELDQRISHLPVRAYTESEGVRLPGGTRGPRPVAPDGPLSEDFDHTLTLRSDDPEGAPAGNVIGPFPGPPEPLRVVQDYRPIRPMLNIEVEAAVPRTRSDSGRQPVPMRLEDPPPRWEEGRGIPPSTVPTSSVPDAKPRGRNADAALPTYVVSPGDTLSGLAKRFLGSTHRYRELYDENRDVLSDPNRLREGMVLRIPQAR